MGAPPSQKTESTSSTTANRSSMAALNSDNDAASTSKAELEAAYTSLIQQYLQVMCLDNATFLAERMVASIKSSNSLYLLAMCHYRNHNPQRALCVLDDCKEHNAATSYLLATCCYQLEQYQRAEEVLLRQARVDYKDYKLTTPAGEVLPMDEWIMDTSPCPIPNGAAGCNLLANICRRSNRKQRAMQYYRMSLQVCRNCKPRFCVFFLRNCPLLTLKLLCKWTARPAHVDEL